MHIIFTQVNTRTKKEKDLNLFPFTFNEDKLIPKSVDVYTIDERNDSWLYVGNKSESLQFTRIQLTKSATMTCLGIVPIHWSLTPLVWVPCEEKFHNSLFICKLHGRNNKTIRYLKDLLECDTNSTFMQINRLAEIFCYEVI